VLEHGKSMKIFRTFHTIRNGGNAAIHSLLMALEKRAQENVGELKGRLQHTVFLQVDGGSENATQLTIAVCELLIAKGLCDKVRISSFLVQYNNIDLNLITDCCFKTYGWSYP